MGEVTTQTTDRTTVKDAASFAQSGNLSGQIQDSFQPMEWRASNEQPVFLDFSMDGLYGSDTCTGKGNGSTKVFERPASQAVEPMPAIPEPMKGGPDASPVVLNIQITNVPEVSQGVKPQDWLQQVDTAFAAGAQAVKPVEHYMAQPNAVTDTLVGVGPVLDNALNYYANTSAAEVTKDVQTALDSVDQAIESTLSHPLTPEERAKAAGSVMPLFFFAGDVKEPIHPETVQRLGLDGMKESELSELGILRITRKAGKGGDWPVINERPSPDVVEQTHKLSCVSACGEMLSNGEFKQFELIKELGTPAYTKDLAKRLGPAWTGQDVTDESLDALLSRNSSWAAELRELSGRRYARLDPAHTVVVDGLDDRGLIMIRDPADGTRYEMTRAHFIEHWNGTVLYR